MNTKTLIILFIGAIIVLAGVSVFLLLDTQKQKPSSSSSSPSPSPSAQPTHTAGIPTKNLIELQKQGWVKDVTIGPLGEVNPSTVKIEKDWAVRFTNMSPKDIEVRITGDKDLMVVKITAGKSQMSPIFSTSGAYKFYDSKNLKVTGNIVVE